MIQNPKLLLLPKNRRRGSKPRCHFLTDGSVDQVARRLTRLLEPHGVVASTDTWMPRGFEDIKEADLLRPNSLVEPKITAALREWWLPHGKGRERTPNWDIAATCTIEGRRGMLLVEAKAHDRELHKEELGKAPILPGGGSADTKLENHESIGRAIDLASKRLSRALGRPFNLSRDDHYQLSNRFAWSWKLADLGIPVALVYLAFLNADEMQDQGEPIRDEESWAVLVQNHGVRNVPDHVWNKRYLVKDVPFIPLLRVMDQPLE